MGDYFHEQIFPYLLTAEGDCKVASRIIPLALGFARAVQLLGMDDRFEVEIDAAIETLPNALSNCREEAFDRCVDQHDLSAIADILSNTRALQLLGRDDDPNAVEEMVEKCARFEIDFESWFCRDVMSANCDTGFDYSFRADDVLFSPATVPSEEPLGGAQMNMVRGKSGPMFGCQGVATSAGSFFQVISGGPTMNLVQDNKPQTAPKITIVINPGIPVDMMDTTCHFVFDDGSTLDTHDVWEDRYWWNWFCSWHGEELSPPVSDSSGLCFSIDEPEGWGFAITDWQFNGGELYARKVYDRTNTDVGSVEIGWELTTIELWHRPIR